MPTHTTPLPPAIEDDLRRLAEQEERARREEHQRQLMEMLQRNRQRAVVLSPPPAEPLPGDTHATTGIGSPFSMPTTLRWTPTLTVPRTPRRGAGGSFLSHVLNPEESPSLPLDTITRATEYARRAHGDQRQHGRLTTQYLHDLFMELRGRGITDTDLLAAAVTSRLLRDTPVTRERLRADFGDTITDLVDAMTTADPGKMRTSPGARFLLVASRLVETQWCWDNREKGLFSLRDTYPDFRSVFRPDFENDPDIISMPPEAGAWRDLDLLLGYLPGESGEEE